MNQAELLKLNEEIEDLEETYVELKLYYENKKAELLLTTDFSAELGKAKPTVAEKDSWVKLQCADIEKDYRMIGVTIGSKKRMLDIMLKFVGDD